LHNEKLTDTPAPASARCWKLLAKSRRNQARSREETGAQCSDRITLQRVRTLQADGAIAGRRTRVTSAAIAGMGFIESQRDEDGELLCRPLEWIPRRNRRSSM